jgi:hypothetical protein
MRTRTWITILLLAAIASFSGNMALGQRPSKDAGVDLNQIPDGLTVEVQLVKLTRPIARMIGGKRRSINEVIEFRLSARAPFPARALDPVLAVGKHLVTEYRYVHENELLFTEFEPQEVPNGEVVYFQWGVRPAPGARKATPLKFDREKLRTITRGPEKKEQ